MKSIRLKVLFCPRLRREDFLLLFFVVFVNFIDALDFLHAVRQLPRFLSCTTSSHDKVSIQNTKNKRFERQ